MRKISSIILCLIIIVLSLSSLSVSAQTFYSRVYSNDGKEVFSYEVDTADSRKGIQKCFDYIKNLEDDEIYTVVLDKSTYHIGGSLDIYGNTTFDLNGSTIRRADETCPSLLRFGRGSETHYGYDGFKNVTVKNGTFDAARLNNVSMVRFAHAQNVVFDSVDFRNTVKTNHMLTFAACDGVVINNCGFYDMDTTGLSLASNCEAVQIDILREGHFTYPAQDFTPVKNVKVTNCTFKNLGRGLGTHSAVSGHYFENMEFSNNTFENIIGYAIKTVNYRNSVISNNIIKNCGSGIFVGNMTNKGCGNFYEAFRPTDEINSNANITIENNKIEVVDSDYTSLAFGIQILGKVVTASDKKDVVGDYRIGWFRILNNEITSSVSKKSYYGIWLQGVKGNAKDTGYDAIVTNNSSLYFGNKNSKTIYGIRLEDSDGITLDSNESYDTNTKTPVLNSGVYATSIKNLQISNNNFKNTKSFGIKFDKVTNGSVYKNVVSNTGNNAIYVNTGCSNFNLTNNTVSKSKGYGIVANSSTKSYDISKNTISNTKGYALYLKGNSDFDNVSSNYIYNVKTCGVYMNSTAKVGNINENIIDINSSTKSAIHINDKASVKNIKGNKINTKTKKNSKKLVVKCKNGIQISSKKCAIRQISNNTIKKYKNKAILVTASSRKPKISKNKV